MEIILFVYLAEGGKQRLGEEFELGMPQTTEVRRAVLDSHWRRCWPWDRALVSRLEWAVNTAGGFSPASAGLAGYLTAGGSSLDSTGGIQAGVWARVFFRSGAHGLLKWTATHVALGLKGEVPVLFCYHRKI